VLKEDEVQWMSLALVRDPATKTLHCTGYPSIPLSSPPFFLLSEKHVVGWC